MHPLSKKLDKVSNILETKGLIKEAEELDEVSNALDVEASESVEAVLSDIAVEGAASFGEIDGAAELIAASKHYVDQAMEELASADRDLDAAKKKKKKWIKGIKLEKGRLGRYRREGESMAEAAKRALQSEDPSVRGMGSFYFAMHGKKKEMEAAVVEAAGDRYARPVVETQE